MIRTFDFVFSAHRDPQLMEKLLLAMENEDENVVYTDGYHLVFDSGSKYVLIDATDKNCLRASGIIPQKLSYRALKNMLTDIWDDFEEADIIEPDIHWG